MTDAAATAVDKGIAMQPGHIDKRLEKATAICRNNGDKLTQKRQRVLQVLMKAEHPLSAYEVTDFYNQEAEIPISAVSVYRILDFLASVNLAYRLSTLGKYIACERIGDSTHAEVTMFVICKRCALIEKVSATQRLLPYFTNLPETSDFEMSGAQIEVTSLCKNCRRKTTPKKQEKA